MKKRNLFITHFAIRTATFIVFLNFSISYSQNTPPEVTVRELLRIGHNGADKETSEDYFGNIRGLVTDRQANLYVLDAGLLEIRIYAQNGKPLKRLTLKRGKGPGEFNAPKHIGIDSFDRLYVVCQTNQNITILSQDGEYINSTKLPFMPSGLALSADKLYVTRFWLSGSGGVVNRYSQNLEFEKSFLDTPQNASMVAMTGNFEHIQTNRPGNLLYSYPIPYKIIELSSDGEIVNQSSGQSKFTELPKKEKIGKENVLVMQQGSRGLAVLPDGKVLNIVQSKENFYLDVFSSDLKFLSRIEAKQLGIDRLRYICTDVNGDVYLDVSEPLSHVRKYEIKFH